MRISWSRTTAVALLMAGGMGFAAAQPAQPRPQDLMVPHISTIPGTKNNTKPVQLFVREYDGTDSGSQRRAVLMLHGRTTPALAAFAADNWPFSVRSWAADLAADGLDDVFVMDLQGSGRSPLPDASGQSMLPEMDDACNVNPAAQQFLIPNPLSAACSATYPYQLNNSQSDWDELDTVVEFIRNRPGRQVDKVALIGWSAAAFQIGPYTLQHPEKVESVFFLAPTFDPDSQASAPGTRFGAPFSMPVSTPASRWGFPMNIMSKDNAIGLERAFTTPWDEEQLCLRQREDGIVDVVWNAILENDAVGKGWGSPAGGGLPPEGVHRFRNAFWWGWNRDTVPLDGTLGGTVPVLIVYGDLDIQANTPPGQVAPPHFSVPALYQAIIGTNKLMLRVACTGHFMPWERQARVLYEISEQWIRNKNVNGLTSGSFFVNENGDMPVAVP